MREEEQRPSVSEGAAKLFRPKTRESVGLGAEGTDPSPTLEQPALQRIKKVPHEGRRPDPS